MLVALCTAPAAHAQMAHVSSRHLASNVIVPQTSSFAIDHQGAVRIVKVGVEVSIVEQVATTTMTVEVQNPTGQRLESEMLVPVPDAAVVRGFTFRGGGSEPTAQVLPREEARRIYNEIVAKVRDPALLEFAGYNLVRSSVFPVEPNAGQTVRLVYENILPADGDRIDYVLPRSESIAYSIPWQIGVKITSQRAISTVYSPTHTLQTSRGGDGEVTAQVTTAAGREPGPFRLSYLLEGNGLTASLLAYPDPGVGGGYFLMLAGLPARPPTGPAYTGIKREVTIVIDRSGSMAGDKLKQVREAARQILAGLEVGETFNVIVYNEIVDLFAKQPVVKNDGNLDAAMKFLTAVQARGGTNIHDALVEVLRQPSSPGTLPVVIFLTDGLPTVGQTSEVSIRNLAINANPSNRRVFTIGVGVDVNTPLLERIASETRATCTIILPTEDVELKVAQVFKRLSGPVMAAPQLVINPGYNLSRVTDMIPARLPDLFENDQIVLLGKYLGNEPLVFEISGNYLGQSRKFTFNFTMEKATTLNAFVPRLWASRKIATLIDAIRQLGADSSSPQNLGGNPTTADPRAKELIEEIVRLSREFGILTEYTAFLAREGTDLASGARLLSEAGVVLEERAVKTRSGLGAANQVFNLDMAKRQTTLNYSNSFYDKDMNRVEITTVQQVADRAFYNRNGRWVDSRLVTQESTVQPRKVIEFGSEEFRQLARRLADEGRAGTIALRGDVLMMVDNEAILVKSPASAP